MKHPDPDSLVKFSRDITVPGEVVARIREIKTTGRPVAVAFSGGADSTAALLWAVGVFGANRVVALHYHHGVRGDDADADLEHAGDFAKTLGVGFVAERRERGLPSEEASLRRDRLHFLVRASREIGAAAVIQGHHADDVTETLLMRLGRGSGSAGLASPRPVSSLRDGTPILRPLIGMRKQILETMLRALGTVWRHDETNDLPEVATRNRIRHTVAPAWTTALPGDAVAGASRSRRLLQEDDEALESWADRLNAEIAPAIATPVDRAWFAALPRAVTRRLLHKVLSAIAPGWRLDADAFDSLLDSLVSGAPYALSLGSHGTLTLDETCLRLTGKKEAPSRAPALLPIPGAAFWPDGASLSADFTQPGPVDDTSRIFLRPPAEYTLDCGPRVPGERYRPLGSPGSRKLQDAMTDRKIPAEHRNALPVVRTSTETLWCPGLSPSENHRISEWEKPALRLTWTASGPA